MVAMIFSLSPANTGAVSSAETASTDNIFFMLFSSGGSCFLSTKIGSPRCGFHVTAIFIAKFRQCHAFFTLPDANRPPPKRKHTVGIVGHCAENRMMKAIYWGVATTGTSQWWPTTGACWATHSRLMTIEKPRTITTLLAICGRSQCRLPSKPKNVFSRWPLSWAENLPQDIFRPAIPERK